MTQLDAESLTTLQNRGHLGWVLSRPLDDQKQHVDKYYADLFANDEDVYDIAYVATELIASGKQATPAAILEALAEMLEDNALDDIRRTLPTLADATEAWTEAKKMRARRDARLILDAETNPEPADLDAEYLDAAELDSLPTPVPLIAGVLDRHSYAILRGRDGTYKTFAALDWSLSLATGRCWQGRHTERVPVLYLAGEGAYGLAARVSAWTEAHRAAIEPGWFTVRKSMVNLYTGGPALEHLVEKITGGRYGLVVVDTLRRASGSADGNGSDMGVVVDNVERIKRATDDGSVLVIAHTDKGDNDSRGFSGIEDDADIVWHAKREQDSDRLDLRCTKYKDGPDGGRVALVARTVGDSLVLDSALTIAPDDMYDTDREVLETLADLHRSGERDATTKELESLLGRAHSTVHKALQRLLSSEQITRRRDRGGYVFQLSSSSGPTAVTFPLESHGKVTPAELSESHPAEHESTPSHGEVTPKVTSSHTDPPVYRPGGVTSVDDTEAIR